MKHQKDYYTAKEKLGLLSFGDPGSGDKVQVGDTYLISIARKIDNKIKAHPELKKKLVRIKNSAGSASRRLTSLNLLPRKKHYTLLKEPKIDINPSLEKIRFTSHKNPLVSIIIPAFNKVTMTVSCLQSLQELDDRVSFETIVVDNGSSDETLKLKNIPGLIYVRNKENLGFVGGCNSGIPHAAGKYIVFLNNDAEVDADWLFYLHKTIEDDKSIGLVGSKIIYPNGVLQEAGGIIFQDGSGLNYGKFDQADSYQYQYTRDVDYCSGASIIVHKEFLESCGGFDKIYQPAYYEDTDLSFKVRESGMRVVYQPLSVIYHIEGGTAGTNLNTGFKKYQEINREKFLKRWGKTLASSHYSADDYYLARDRSGDKLALILEESVPTPDKDSGSVRMIAMIKALQSLGYKVTFWPNGLERKEPYCTNLQQMGVEVVYGSIDFLQFAKHYAHFYDMVILSRPEIGARYINICKSLFTNAKLIYDTVDLHYVRLARQAEVEVANAEALNEQSKWYKILEIGLMERTDATLVVSDKEVELLASEGVEANIVVVSNIHSIRPDAYDNAYSDRRDIIFVGNYAHLPNRDGIIWFISDIFPSIKDSLKDVKLHIVGANMPAELERKLKGKKDVIIDGYVSDFELSELLKQSRVFIAPLRYGAGVKGKIGQSIEYGLPIVTTSIGAEGMFLRNDYSCLEADTPKEFADAVVSLYHDEQTWEKIRKNARKVIANHFSLSAAVDGLRSALHL